MKIIKRLAIPTTKLILPLSHLVFALLLALCVGLRWLSLAYASGAHADREKLQQILLDNLRPQGFILNHNFYRKISKYFTPFKSFQKCQT